MLAPCGFRFELREAGRGSGGRFAWGEYVRDDRRLELHFRYSLGLVTYHAGRFSIAHEPYLLALGVPRGDNQYPGFSDDPLEGFRSLAHDLSRFCREFLSGDATILRRIAIEETSRLRTRGRLEIAGYIGDERKRREARTHFHAGEYGRVVVLLEQVQYPDLLRDSERQMLELARRRTGK